MVVVVVVGEGGGGGGGGEPRSICEKSCQLPVPGSGGTNQIAEQNLVNT